MNGEQSNGTGIAVDKFLRNAEVDVDNVGTAAREVYSPDLHAVLDTLHGVIDTLGEAPGRGHLDHLWIYVDQTGQ